MALITKRDTVLTTVPSVIPIKEADENSGAVLASVDGSYDVDIDETLIKDMVMYCVQMNRKKSK